MNAPRKPRPAPASRPLPTLETLAAAAALGTLGLVAGGCHGPLAGTKSGAEPGAQRGEQGASLLDFTRWFTGPGTTSTTPEGPGFAPCNYVPPGTTTAPIGTAPRTITGTGPTVPIAPAGAPVAITPIPPRITGGGARAFTPHPPSRTTTTPTRTHR